MSSKQTVNTHTITDQTQGPEEWVQNEGSNLYKEMKNSTPRNYKIYKGERVADYGEDYYTARQNIRDLDAAGTPDLDKYSGILDDLYGMDKEYLGKSMQQKMNPYTAAVLDPTLRAINEQRGMALNEEAASATMAGAFGDPQAGIGRALSGEKFAQATTDASNQAYSQAWDKAQKQAKDDVAYNDWYMSKAGMNGYAQQRLPMLLQFLNATPQDQVMHGVSDSTQKTDDGGAGMMQMIGKLVGTAIGAASGNPAAASGGGGSILSSLFGGGGGGG